LRIESKFAFRSASEGPQCGTGSLRGAERLKTHEIDFKAVNTAKTLIERSSPRNGRIALAAGMSRGSILRNRLHRLDSRQSGGCVH
jgi:hypothetical protein